MTDDLGSPAGDGGPEPYTAAAMDARMLKVPLTAVIIVGVISTAIATFVAGSAGLLAGAIATVVVGAFFGIGQYVVSRVLRNNPMVAMNTALLTFVLQMLCLFILLLVLRDATFFNAKAFAATIVACALAWTVAMVAVLMRTKVLYVEPGSGPTGSPGSTD